MGGKHSSAEFSREREEPGVQPRKGRLINADFLPATFIFLYYLSCIPLNLKRTLELKSKFSEKDRMCLSLKWRSWGRGWCLASWRAWVRPSLLVSFIDSSAMIRTDTVRLAVRILHFASASHLDLSLVRRCCLFGICLL